MQKLVFFRKLSSGEESGKERPRLLSKWKVSSSSYCGAADLWIPLLEMLIARRK